MGRLLSLSLFSLLLSPSRSEAQTFAYNPLNGTRNLTLTLNSDTEWMRDPWNNSFYAANLHERIRVLGNPYLRSVSVRFASFRTYATAVGGLGDSLTLRWTDTTAGQAVLSALYTASISANLAASGTRSLMSPGALMVFRTGPTWSGSGAFIDSEEDGFLADRVTVGGNGAIANSSITTLVPHPSSSMCGFQVGPWPVRSEIQTPAVIRASTQSNSDVNHSMSTKT